MTQRIALIVFLLQASQCYSVDFEPDTVVVSRTRGEWGVVLCMVGATQALVCWDTLISGHLAVGAGWISEQGTEGNCPYNTSLSCMQQTLMNGTSLESIQELYIADDINVTYEGMSIRSITLSASFRIH